ncbi:hypothetical protein HOLleu_06664 [Holothuria leucospilota]|uniref:Uncharacterized protein n=1 Tax=Holothuria leucospilota TaxID=206669 RepID=A0A9Q1HFA9_HOLLE|nr:hypothetical protein HOLleu_06664 [Holothuria leucospilota]
MDIVYTMTQRFKTVMKGCMFVVLFSAGLNLTSAIKVCGLPELLTPKMEVIWYNNKSHFGEAHTILTLGNPTRDVYGVESNQRTKWFHLLTITSNYWQIGVGF